MTELGFVLVLTVVVSGILVWGLRVLPRENMQILATVPRVRGIDGTWEGLNLTWYGLLQALGITLGLAVTLALASAQGVSLAFLGLFLPAILGVSLPAARWVAAIVEKTRGTFTVGGAVFVAMLAALPVGFALDLALGTRHTLPLLSAAAIGYPLGEGIGRLACISFGCCYGKRVQDLGPVGQRLFHVIATVPRGPTRKSAYAGHCEGQPLVPTQAISAVALSAFALTGTGVFLLGYPRAGAVLALTLTHAFRFAIEFLRADNRGKGKVTPYQWMSLISIPAVFAIFTVPAAMFAPAHLDLGLATLRSPLVAAALATTAIAVFLYLGRSRVTYAQIRLGVRER